MSGAQAHKANIAQLALLLHKTPREIRGEPYVDMQEVLAVHNANRRIENAYADGTIPS